MLIDTLTYTYTDTGTCTYIYMCMYMYMYMYLFFSQPYLAMKHLQKKQGVGVAKEPQRNIKILGLRLHYRFGNHALQIPSNYFHSSAFHKRFSLKNTVSFAWDDHNAVYHSPLCFRNLVQKILVLKGHPQGL